MSANGIHLIECDASLARLYQPPPAVSAALPEARCSVNVKVKLWGHEVLLTLRGHEEQDVLARLEAVLAGVPRPVALESGEGFCHTHQVQMTLNEKHGKQWWSHRRADGHWCKGH